MKNEARLKLHAIQQLVRKCIGIVVGTTDGDTLQAQVDEKLVTVRLAYIDSPEVKQAGSRESTERLNQLLSKNQIVTLRTVGRDRHNRLVAEVFKCGQSINLKMVQEGHAVVYRQYLPTDPDTRNRYLQAEATAKHQRLGFWSKSNSVMPWEFRKLNR